MQDIVEYRVFESRRARNLSQQFISSIMQRYDLSYMSAVLLCQMGFSNLDECDEYLFCKEKNLLNPYLFSDMEKICLRIEQAIMEAQRIVIYSDYDCDGIMSAVILKKTLDRLGAQSTVYIPSRFATGYGLSEESVRELYAQGAHLILTADNGIVANAEARLVQELGMDLIITDHHTPSETLPQCAGILCAKVKGERYPFQELCGAGVALKLALALLKRAQQSAFGVNLLAYAAIATIADMVPLTGENRTIVSLGLQMLNRCEDAGLRALLKASGYADKTVESGMVAFQIAPRINAVGRMGEVDDLLALFLEADEREAKQLSCRLEQINTLRKEKTAAVLQACEEILERDCLLEKQKVLFFFVEQAPKGVVGLAAGKLAEKYNRPCVVFSVEGDMATGSARSVRHFDIYEALLTCRERYIKFGGHKAAAGLTVYTKDLNSICEAVNARAETLHINSVLTRHVLYDLRCHASHLTKKFVSELELFAPFGMANPKPVFYAHNVKLQQIAFMGSDKSHARLTMVFENSAFHAVYFSGAKRLSALDTAHQTYDVLFCASINTYSGTSQMQLEIVDLMESVDVEDQFYESLYLAFCRARDENGFAHCRAELQTMPSLALTLEEVLSRCLPEDILVSQSPQTLSRILRYLSYTDAQIHLCYSHYDVRGESPGCVNVLVCPLDYAGVAADRRLIYLDETIFAGYPVFHGTGVKLSDTLPLFYIPTKIDREFVLEVYKSLRLLGAYGGDMHKLLLALSRTAKVPLNSFCLKLCLDVMQELAILSYDVYNTKLDVRFHPVTQKKNIEDSRTVQYLSECYERLKKE